jgi:hypothetical protein
MNETELHSPAFDVLSMNVCDVCSYICLKWDEGRCLDHHSGCPKCESIQRHMTATECVSGLTNI